MPGVDMPGIEYWWEYSLVSADDSLEGFCHILDF